MDKEYVTTSDQSFAAYLMLHDYTVITCVDPEDGRERYDFYLTHSDPEIRDNLFEHFNKLRDEFASADRKYLEYHKHLKRLRSLAYNPVRKSQYGN